MSTGGALTNEQPTVLESKTPMQKFKPLVAGDVFPDPDVRDAYDDWCAAVIEYRRLATELEISIRRFSFVRRLSDFFTKGFTHIDEAGARETTFALSRAEIQLDLARTRLTNALYERVPETQKVSEAQLRRSVDQLAALMVEIRAQQVGMSEAMPLSVEFTPPTAGEEEPSP